MKREVRIIGFDDSPFERNWKETYLVGTIAKANGLVEGFVIDKIQIDGNDVTEKIIKLVTKSRHYKQLRYIMLNGITFAGFNVADIEKIYLETNLPVIVVTRKNPNFEEILKALRKINQEWKIKLMEKAGKPREVKTKFGKVYIQFKGIDFKEAKELVKLTCIRSKTPEPIRISHLLARALIYGESKGETSH